MKLPAWIQPEGDESFWELMVDILQDLFHEPDLQAARALYAAIAAHDLPNGQPVWPMLVDGESDLEERLRV